MRRGQLTRTLSISLASLLLVALALMIPIIHGSPQSYVFIKSVVDFDGDGVDDYTDIMLGARADALRLPEYDDSYYVGGYPPESIGVCADVIWRAFRDAGYSLRDMVDLDIKNSPISYSSIDRPDSNIDFRRVTNLKVFFSRHCEILTCDVTDTASWQAGDIVVFGNNVHIGIISDKRNAKGVPYVIHNSGQLDREEDYLSDPDNEGVTGHYRFDASRIDPALLIEWKMAG